MEFFYILSHIVGCGIANSTCQYSIDAPNRQISSRIRPIFRTYCPFKNFLTASTAPSNLPASTSTKCPFGLTPSS
jgi:hypothetical protein